MKNLILGILIIFVLALVGCSAQTIIKYQCADGSFVDSVDSCPKSTTQTDCPDLDCSACDVGVQTKEIIKYQCQDGSLRDKISDCPKVEKTDTKMAQTDSEQCLKLLNHDGSIGRFGWYEIKGGVKNDCPTTRRYVKLIFTFYDSSNNVIGTDVTFTAPTDMPAGMTAGFESVETDEDVSARIARYEVYLTSN